MTNTFISRANRINERFCDVYEDAFREMVEIARERKIVKIDFSLHSGIGIDVPRVVFEVEHFNEVRGISSEYCYEELGEMVFNESYNYITLISKNGNYGSMDEHWGDFFDIVKVGQIYQAFMEIVGNDDLKEIELA